MSREQDKWDAGERDYKAARDMPPQTEDEELAAACQTLGRKLEDIAIEDFRWVHGPVHFNYMATWDDYDCKVVMGTGRTPEEAMWSLIDFTKVRA